MIVVSTTPRTILVPECIARIAYAGRTVDPDALERVMHEAFGPKRFNGRREFFHVQPEQAMAVLALHYQGWAGADAQASSLF